MAKSKRNGKDSVFLDLSYNKKYTPKIVKALNPSLNIKAEDIEFVTLHSVLMIKSYNDLGLLIKDNLLICSEAQSTWSLNVLIRMFMYLAETYHRYIQNDKTMNIYGSKKIKIPTPECYVIYTGSRKNCPETLSLAKEFFGNDSALNLKVKVLSKAGKTNIIEEYITFCHVLDEQVKLYGPTKKAIEETIKICQTQNILAEYLEERKKEVVDIMSILFSQEEVTERYGYERFLEGKNEGLSQGITQGLNQASENIALNMLRKNMSVNEIAECTALPPARVMELAKTL